NRSAEDLQQGNATEKLLVAPIELASSLLEIAAGHAEELVTAHFDIGEAIAKQADILSPQRLFVRSVFLAGIGQPPPCPVQQRVAAPGLAEDGVTAGLEDARQFRSCPSQIEMVQHGMAPAAG